MQPVKSSSNKENCLPISSNCVLWQGPNLPCIGLCTGDSISDVTYRIAETVCELKSNFNLTDVDVTCLLTICSQTPEPQKTITNILNLLINKVCCLNDIVETLINPADPAEKNVLLAPCFNITNPFGVPLTELPVSEYVYYMGVKVCEIAGTVALHTSQISSLQTQINNLPDPTPIPQVTPDCVLSSVPTNVDVVVEALEAQFCSLRTALGQVTDITTARGRQCTDLNSQPSLVTGLPMSSLPNWVVSPANLAQSLQNLWLTVCDLRAAVKFIQDTCCNVSCQDLLVDFDVVYGVGIDSSTGKTKITLTLFFGVDTVNIPAQFHDCDQVSFTKLTITDQSGHSVVRYIKIRDVIGQTGILDGTPTEIQNGYELTLLGTPLVQGEDLTITADICLTDGTITCTKCYTRVVTASTSCNCEITAKGNVTIVYKTC